MIDQQKIIHAAYDAAMSAGGKTCNPYPRNSIEYRYWQDGERQACSEMEWEEEKCA